MVSTDIRPPRRGLRGPAWCGFCAALTAALVTAVAASGTAGSDTRPPRLDYTVTTLANGLRVILLEDHSTPIVNVQVWYHVGSKDERAGRTGFAHLFEHLMFKGSKNVGPDRHASIISGLGGQANAYTTEDVTVFWETVPSQFLPAVLWLEADRMATLRIDKSAFTSEREVVKEERRMRIENQPYGRLAEIVFDQAFAVHPYKHATIGAMEDLEAASVDDVREFFRTYYVPANATVTIAGDIDRAQAADLAATYFGRIPASGQRVPRDIPAEPPATGGPRRVSVEESWPLPVVVVAHHVPYDGHPDSYPLQVAAKILSGGQSSRLYRKLVYNTGMAQAAAGVGNLTEDPSLFYAFAIVQPGHTPSEAALALTWEIDRLRREPISAGELTRARTQITRDYVLGRETVQQKAGVLAHASVLHKGDVASADAEFDLLQGVTAEDVQRVAQRYFGPEGRLVLTVLPKAAKDESR